MNTIETQAPVLEDLIALLGSGKVTLPGTDLTETLRNTSHFDPPQVLGWVKPASIEEIQGILALCRKLRPRY
jgi:hypothetical protein